MPRTTARPDPVPEEARLDESVCAEIGPQLARARAERNLTVAMVADSLLLSERQVRALEQAQVGGFYNAAFFLAALRKYAKLVGVETDMPGRPLMIEPPPPDLAEPPPVVARPVLSIDLSSALALLRSRRLRRLALATFAGALLGTSGAVVWSVWKVTSSTPRSVLERHPLLPTVVPAAAVSLERPGVVGETAGHYGAVHVGRTTWVFIRYASGEVVERTLVGGGTQVIESGPIYLAAGIPDIELTLGGRRVDVSRFIVNGEVRLRSADLAALASDTASR